MMHIALVQMADPDEDELIGQECYIVGWGATQGWFLVLSNGCYLSTQMSLARYSSQMFLVLIFNRRVNNL